ncbi:T9SS type A sorting domain-containing protein [Flavisolibacter sp. BT320]|nr:T9SS type A sorting domain-containing protein [Flavisolibacter longurius]
MRTILPLLSLLFFVQQVHANIVQGSYRWRNDDGNETTATWKSAQNTSIGNVSAGDVLRLRFNLYNDYPYDGDTYSIQLWYNDGTTSRQVTTSATGAFMLASSAHVTNGQATTAQFGGSMNFVPGTVVTSSNDVSILLPASSRTEYEWVIKPTTDLLNARTYTFEVRGSNVAAPSGPASTLMTSGTLPLKLLSFIAQLAEKAVTLQWNTAEEEQVAYFEIEKSTDGHHYQPIGKQPAAGRGAHAYRFTDNSTIVSNTYYRLKMVDNNGSFTYSPVSRVRSGQSSNSISVYPNPAKDRLNISLTADAGPVQVGLHDVGGRIIKTFTVQSDGSTINKVADISSLKPGIYFISFNKQIVRFVKE